MYFMYKKNRASALNDKKYRAESEDGKKYRARRKSTPPPPSKI